MVACCALSFLRAFAAFAFSSAFAFCSAIERKGERADAPDVPGGEPVAGAVTSLSLMVAKGGWLLGGSEKDAASGGQQGPEPMSGGGATTERERCVCEYVRCVDQRRRMDLRVCEGLAWPVLCACAWGQPLDWRAKPLRRV